jgi:K+/H+ antiporter YhaU regulatory subunit KhtT
MIFNPSFESRLGVGDTVIAVGDPVNLSKLQEELNPTVEKD